MLLLLLFYPKLKQNITKVEANDVGDAPSNRPFPYSLIYFLQFIQISIFLPKINA